MEFTTPLGEKQSQMLSARYGLSWGSHQKMKEATVVQMSYLRPTTASRQTPVSSLVLALLGILFVVVGCATHRAGALETENQRRMPSICPVRHEQIVITSRFGVRKDPFTGQMRQHNAVDFSAPMRAPVVATADGSVIYAGREGGYGRIIKIEHGRGIETWYGHLHAMCVKMGQWVSRGERIGKLGQSGRTTGPNLHYEVHINGKPVNPAKYLP